MKYQSQNFKAARISQSFRRATTRHGHGQSVMSFRPLSKKWKMREDIPPDRTKALPRRLLFFLCGMIFFIAAGGMCVQLRETPYCYAILPPTIATLASTAFVSCFEPYLFTARHFAGFG
jgi:hypothetical protein